MNLSRNSACAIAAIAVLGLIGPTASAAPRSPTGYLKVQVSEKSAVYLEFRGDELRAAMSAEGLKTAEPVKMVTSADRIPRSSTFALPIPSDQLPEGVTAVMAAFERLLGENMVSAELGICRTDEQKVEWRYEVRSYVYLRFSPGSAAAISLPNLVKLTLAVTAKPSAGKVGVGVRLMAGTDELSGVLKDGKPVQVEVRVLDAAGEQKAAKTGPLSDFGFS